MELYRKLIRSLRLPCALLRSRLHASFVIQRSLKLQKQQLNGFLWGQRSILKDFKGETRGSFGNCYYFYITVVSGTADDRISLNRSWGLIVTNMQARTEDILKIPEDWIKIPFTHFRSTLELTSSKHWSQGDRGVIKTPSAVTCL